MKLVSRMLVLASLLAFAAPAWAQKKAVVRASGLNLRSLPSLDAPVLGKLQAGEEVELIAEVDGTDKGAPPRRWARISTTGKAGRPVWASTRFIDPNGVVSASTLKLRSGPGPQFSEVGLLRQGDRVAVAETRDGWNRLEDSDWVGYVALEFLQVTAAPTPALATLPAEVVPSAPAPTAPPAPPADGEIRDLTGGRPVPPPAPPARAAVPPAPVPPPAAETAAISTIPGNVVTLPSQPEIIYEAKKPRIVLRDGIVRRSLSPKKPTFYELRSHRGEGVLNLLVSDDPALNLDAWLGRRATVTG
ncbi:MAG: SH3 domain-containing protein, partial [Verrucomicrobiota bacterium]